MIDVCPPVGKTPVTAANNTARRARKKYGMLSAAYARNELILSKSESFFTAAITPRGIATAYDSRVLARASISVGMSL